MNSDAEERLLQPTYTQEDYERAYSEYSHHPEEHELKADFIQPGNPNIGYKCHLNIAPEDVEAVAKFLKGAGFRHKYLRGGDVGQGKIFTVYLGSKENTEKCIKEIYGTIHQFLLPPKDPAEVELAPNICGRFTGTKPLFHQYGFDGVSILFKDMGQIRNARIKHGLGSAQHQQAIEHAAANAKIKLTEIYGDYYGGGVNKYIPE